MPKTPENILVSVRKYNASKKGVATRKAYLEKNKDKLSAWKKVYFKKLRQTAKLSGICGHCLKRPVGAGVVCEPCRLRNKENAQRRRDKRAGK